MFEQFTARAREVMKLARQESERLHGEYIGTEHFLLGLIKEGNGEAAKVLQSLHVDTDNLRTEVEKLVESGPGTVTKGRLSLTPQAINVVQYAMKEAHHLNHNYVGAEHILTGLLCEREGVAAQVLNNRGVTLEGVRASILSLLGPSTFDRTQGDGGEGMGKSEESAAEPPAVCSACGYPRIVRVLWNWVHLWGKMAEDVRSGKAILGSRYGGAGPPWVCLQCVPEWSEVHRLATLEWQWLLAKEEALNSREFEKAELCRDAQDEVRQRLSCVVEELSKTQRNPST
jgi:hypothetical protein